MGVERYRVVYVLLELSVVVYLFIYLLSRYIHTGAKIHVHAQLIMNIMHITCIHTYMYIYKIHVLRCTCDV